MIKAHRLMALARAKGADWTQINESMAQLQQAALDTGTPFWDMTNAMGFGDPQIMRDRVRALVDAEHGDADDPTASRIQGAVNARQQPVLSSDEAADPRIMEAYRLGQTAAGFVWDGMMTDEEARATNPHDVKIAPLPYAAWRKGYEEAVDRSDK